LKKGVYHSKAEPNTGDIVDACVKELSIDVEKWQAGEKQRDCAE